MYVALDEGVSKLPVGEYNATIGVFYEGLSNSEDFNLKIVRNNGYLIIIGFVVVAILGILWGLYIFKNNKRSKK